MQTATTAVSMLSRRRFSGVTAPMATDMFKAYKCKKMGNKQRARMLAKGSFPRLSSNDRAACAFRKPPSSHPRERERAAHDDMTESFPGVVRAHLRGCCRRGIGWRMGTRGEGANKVAVVCSRLRQKALLTHAPYLACLLLQGSRVQPWKCHGNK